MPFGYLQHLCWTCSGWSGGKIAAQQLDRILWPQRRYFWQCITATQPKCRHGGFNCRELSHARLQCTFFSAFAINCRIDCCFFERKLLYWSSYVVPPPLPSPLQCCPSDLCSPRRSPPEWVFYYFSRFLEDSNISPLCHSVLFGPARWATSQLNRFRLTGTQTESTEILCQDEG